MNTPFSAAQGGAISAGTRVYTRDDGVAHNAPRESELADRCGALSVSIDSLHVTVDRLIERLSPVIRPLPQPAATNEKTSGGYSPLGAQINEAACLVAALRDRLAAVTDALAT